MRVRVYKIYKGVAVGTSVFVGGFFYTCLVILGMAGVGALIYAVIEGR